MACSSANSSEPVNTKTETLDSAVVHKLFITKCAICHGEDGKLGYANSKDLSVSQLTKNEVVAIIKYGRTTMPPQSTLSDEEIAALADFTMKLRQP